MAPLARICLIGPECTGKSELAVRLAEHFDAVVVPEFARQYAVERGVVLTFEDVEPIARGQMAAEDAAPSDALVILDTDLLSTVVYSRYYYGTCPEWIEREARRRRSGLYLLTDTDILWAPDGIRDTGGEEREELFDGFRRALDEFETEWVIVSGRGEARFDSALSRLRETLSSRAGARDPGGW